MAFVAQQPCMITKSRGTGLGLLAAACAATGAPLFSQLGGSSPALRSVHSSSPGPRAENAGGVESASSSLDPSSTGSPLGTTGAIVAVAAATTGLNAVTRGRSLVRRPAAVVAAAVDTAEGGSRVSSGTEASLQFDPTIEVGALAPLGFFDPLGFAKPGDEAGFRTLREAELKHGRVAMVAAIGLPFQHFVRFPSFEQVPSGFAALTTGPGALGFLAVVIASGVFELAWRTDPVMEGGTFGAPLSIEKLFTRDLRNKELSNGRFAMMSVLGILAAELVTSRDAVQQLGL